MMFDPQSLQRKITRLGIRFESYKPVLSDLHRVRISKSLQDKACEWCETEFEDDWIWSSPFQMHYCDFYFKKSENALAFKLTFFDAITT